MKTRYAKRLILCTNTDRVGGVKSLQHFNLDTVVGFATQKSEIKRGINPEIKKRSKKRGDNTLLVYVLKSVTAWLWKRNVKIYNRYGFSVLKIEKERGTMDGKVQKKKYYLMSAKIYRKRFATDCFADYFNDMALRTNVGLNDYREYLTECASVNELQAQNSYFINALYGLGGDS